MSTTTFNKEKHLKESMKKMSNCKEALHQEDKKQDNGSHYKCDNNPTPTIGLAWAGCPGPKGDTRFSRLLDTKAVVVRAVCQKMSGVGK